MDKEVHVFEGRTTSEAINLGLNTLNVSKNDVEIKVLEGEKRSFFSILTPRVVKVEMKLKEKKVDKKNNKYENIEESEENINRSIENLKQFLDKWLVTLPTKNIEYNINYNNNMINIEFNSEDISYLIGYRGEVMKSLQVILTAVAQKNLKTRLKVSLDILGYKDKRTKILENLADKLANKVIKTRKTIVLEPMTAYERKIIHMRLQNNEYVKTVSIGEGNNRRLTIELK